MMTLPTKTDLELREQILAELGWDTRILRSDLDVDVRSGVVTLAGAVDSWARRFAAGDAVSRLSGVFEVHNGLTVDTPAAVRPADDVLAASVRSALEWDVLVPDHRVRSEVSDGVVTLSGEVAYWSQAEDAEIAIRNLAGVQAIVNLVTVDRAAVGREVHRAIEEALTRHATRAAQHVKIDLADQGVTVSGHVDSWAERAAVLGAVRAIRGVATVEDRLSIW